MELNDVEFLTVLDVLYDRISHLRILCKHYPHATLRFDWKSEISILEKFCKALEDSNIKPVSDDIILKPIIVNNTLDD